MAAVVLTTNFTFGVKSEKMRQLEIRLEEMIQHWDELYNDLKSKIKYDGVLMVPLEDKYVTFHEDEHVFPETALSWIRSEIESFWLDMNGKLMGKCPCSVHLEGEFGDECPEYVRVEDIFNQLDVDDKEELGSRLVNKFYRLQRENLKKNKNGVDCPYCVDPDWTEGIGFPLIREIRGNIIWANNIRHCRQCNTCGRTWCIKCECPYIQGELLHDNNNCRIMKKIKKAKEEGVDFTSENYIPLISTKCPKCGINIQKRDGCNHMTCNRCGREFCYKCGKPWWNHQSCS